MDMLVKLYALPPLAEALDALMTRGISVRRAMPYERRQTLAWVNAHFNALWADECAVAFGRQPIGCFVAVGHDGLAGFCCAESTFRNFIGPIGTATELRRQGVGRALALAALWHLRDNGYAYAVVGDVGHPEFFQRAVGAVKIEGSSPGPYPPKIAGDSA